MNTTLPISLNVELSDQEALDFAQFLKRIGLSDFRSHARDDDEAYRMQQIAEKIRLALDEAGVSPR